MAEPLTPADPAATILLAARALGKIDLYGTRGLTMVSTAEIEAMALMLAHFEMRPLPPESAAPSDARSLMSIDAIEFLSNRF
jgi:hypothetical protein